MKHNIWETTNLERLAKDTKEISESLSATLKRAADFFNEAIDNAPNEHVTDNSIKQVGHQTSQK